MGRPVVEEVWCGKVSISGIPLWFFWRILYSIGEERGEWEGEKIFGPGCKAGVRRRNVVGKKRFGITILEVANWKRGFCYCV